MALRAINEAISSAVSMSASSNSSSVCLDYCKGFSIQAVITADASAVGSLKLQASCDDGMAPTNWSDVANSSIAVAGAGSAMWDYPAPGFRHVRLVYTRTSGSATLNARCNQQKEI